MQVVLHMHTCTCKFESLIWMEMKVYNCCWPQWPEVEELNRFMQTDDPEDWMYAR